MSRISPADLLRLVLEESGYNAMLAADSSSSKVYPGIGAPEFEGYDATPHKAACK